MASPRHVRSPKWGLRSQLEPPTWFPVISVEVEVAPLQESYILEVSAPERDESS